jgi:hypothetical protein
LVLVGDYGLETVDPLIPRLLRSKKFAYYRNGYQAKRIEMNLQLFVHLGMRMTGSKALQSALRSASGDSFVYPLSRDGELWHQAIHYALIERDAAPLEEALAQIRGAPVGVLSYEAFHELDDAALALLAERARANGREVKAVIFLRRQDEYVASLINQFWKAHRVSHADAQEKIAALLSGATLLDYDQLLHRLSNHFAAVIPIIYDKWQSSVKQFADATGIWLRDAANGIDLNPASSAVEMATLKAVKKLAGADPRLPQIVESTGKALAQPGLARTLATIRDRPAATLSHTSAQEIMRKYVESNQRLSAQWFEGREPLFRPSRLPPFRSEYRPRSDVIRKIRREFQL